jgi:hypothetical protein
VESKNINWPEFRAAFHANHLPQGGIKLKKRVSGSKKWVHVYERVCHQVHSIISLCPK